MILHKFPNSTLKFEISKQNDSGNLRPVTEGKFLRRQGIDTVPSNWLTDIRFGIPNYQQKPLPVPSICNEGF